MGDLFDLHAALDRADGHELPASPVEQEGQVELLRDVAGLLDEHLVHGVALDVHAEDLAGLGVRVIGAFRYLDSASLAPAAGLDLRLDDHLRSAGRGELSRDRPRLVRRMSDLSARHGHAVLGEELFGLMLEQVHVSVRP